MSCVRRNCSPSKSHSEAPTMARIDFIGASGTWCYDDDKPLGPPGGFGTVYEGFSSEGVPIAVKVVSKQAPGRALDDRLLHREVEIGRRVADIQGDSFLLPAIDWAETDSQLILVMRRAERSLADMEMPTDESAVLGVGTDIATGLLQIHSVGIIHRDLKPPNVLLHEGRWKLADFGIARDQEIGTQTPTFVGWGSPEYMAPELWQLRSPSIQTDLYALGCILFELVTGVPPYTGPAEALRALHISAPLPSMPSVHPTLKNLLIRLLSKDPGGRPQDARAVLERLERASAASLSPLQQAIAAGLATHASERSQQAAERSHQIELEEKRQGLLMLARTDLSELLADILEAIQVVEPAATLSRSRDSVTLAGPDASMSFDSWDPGTHSLVPNDTMMMGGGLTLSNWRYTKGLLAANIVFERVDDRYIWRVYRFKIGFGPPGNYRFGPWSRMHGLRQHDFFDPNQRYLMIHPAMHVWSLQVVHANVDVIVGLFREAVDLRPPDPRTGLWP